ncbi:predicted coding region AF_1576 [Archaeoglobus fulgidus DSM 4304]|uniref:Uncharacterized protein AF_1576 n=1 Tax=Archaeoglobus fulgidus (strain ATCC 49558 / DSM 4304 / JCM 9628 / NBRC 100126 / VC-16) TaxID=224325 RepID=Y1576_ARCFU|nr:RecName: Full=Uncharacterized protein AF_1576 [Archaeoglobus fulgidus DSM 4304]AAB89680.1 predicted coding region AF_1576 [Archaeoglobus fulgidus DSM 4304]
MDITPALFEHAVFSNRNSGLPEPLHGRDGLCWPRHPPDALCLRCGVIEAGHWQYSLYPWENLCPFSAYRSLFFSQSSPPLAV